MNDTEENAAFLACLKRTHSVVDQIEVLPFKKLCTVKYDRMGIPFRFADIEEPDTAAVKRMEALISEEPIP